MVNHNLTPAEISTIQRLAFGTVSTNKDIASIMNVSPRTVEAHLGSAMNKLNLKNRIQLIRWANENLVKA
jgi:DNA-binding CsgD family transcriptional regulator